MKNLFHLPSLMGLGVFFTLLFLSPLIYVAVTRLIWPLPQTQRIEVPMERLPERKFVNVDGLRISYVQAGSGPDILLIHGLGGHTYLWRYLIPLLEKDFRVTALDLPGFGYSAKPTGLTLDLDSQTQRVVNFLNSIGVDRSCLVGSSMGGTISLWLARTHPDRFPTVFALSPATHPKFIRHFVPLLSIVLEMFPTIVNPYVIQRLWRRTLYWSDIVTEVSLARMWQPMDSPETGRVFLKATKTVFDPRLPQSLSEIKSKVFLFWGREERIIPESDIDDTHRLIGNSELKKMDETSHHPMEDQPVEVAKDIFKHRDLCR
jgi:pimeloyl-ACP methyl ester carboxylesterase